MFFTDALPAAQCSVLWSDPFTAHDTSSNVIVRSEIAHDLVADITPIPTISVTVRFNADREETLSSFVPSNYDHASNSDALDCFIDDLISRRRSGRVSRRRCYSVSGICLPRVGIREKLPSMAEVRE